MGKFIEDYLYLCKVNKQFYKMHWKGVVILNVALIGGCILGVEAYDAYKDRKEFNDWIDAEVEVQ